MRESLQAGLTHEFTFTVPPTKTVPHLYPEAPEFQTMPEVFATGFMVGLIEWACIKLMEPHLDWPSEQSVGTHIDLSHTAATPPGFTVTVRTRLEKVEGRKLTFMVEADDGLELIGQGIHERFVIDTARFNAKVAEKAKQTA
ncbi:MAG: thioesterase family protein [Synechococcaceae cyanobacterium SM1_2_3]|nr:thioesterase family protein [Synechococcaceae cyanobacterium SM1_2_3]